MRYKGLGPCNTAMVATSTKLSSNSIHSGHDAQLSVDLLKGQAAGTEIVGDVSNISTNRSHIKQSTLIRPSLSSCSARFIFANALYSALSNS
jgi:hypothetical protein